MPETGPSNRQVLSVSDLARNARRLLEGEFPMVFVEGEISNFTRPGSGHWYLTLKDDRAQLRCAMFANRNRLVRFQPKNGMQVVIRGRISLYEARGDFQLIGEFMEEAGDGALQRAFEELKAKLQSEGLFAAERKRPLPTMPGHIGVITSPTGAAIRDVLHVLARRFPAIPVSIIPVQVQGETSPDQIVAALEFANRQQAAPLDVLLLTRGGGSLEDLWSFNTEQVARAVHASRLPVICAVGHETDFSIADFVADVRAPTPSAAAELLSPNQADWDATFSRFEQTLRRQMSDHMDRDGKQLGHLARRLRHPGRRLQDLHQRLDDLDMRLQASLRRFLGGFRFDEMEIRLQRAMRHVLERREARLALARSRLPSPAARVTAAESHRTQLLRRLIDAERRQLERQGARLESADARLNAYSPQATLDRGYAIIRKGDAVIRHHGEVAAGDTVTAQLKDGRIIAEIKETKANDD